MKKHLLTAQFIFLIHFSFAQNWSVINLSDKFNYRLNNDQIITTTIWMDSVEANGSDSVFYLNRIMCDTCVTIIGGPNSCDTCYAAKNLPQFLQRYVNVTSNGVVNFRDTGNIVLNTFAQLNDSWLFDSTWNISATVIAAGTDSVFGNNDSVKTILLTSGDTIIFSQNFGVLQFPNGYGMNSYYRLFGIEGRNLGEQVPKFSDFFNFDVGDMFEYHLDLGYGADCHIVEIKKYTIVSKTNYTDSVEYGIDGIFRHTENPYGWWGGCNPWIYVSTFSRTVVYADSAQHTTNKFNFQFLECDDLASDYYAGSLWGQACQDAKYDHIRTYLDSNNVYTKSYGISDDPQGWYTWSYYNYLSMGGDTLNPISFGQDPAWSYSETFKVGLGRTDFGVGPCFEGHEENHLVAYRKGNDTIGIFTEDSMFTVGTQERIYEQDLLIFPNPASSLITISLPLHREAEFSLVDIQGKKLMSESIKGSKAELDISHLETGIYFIIVKTSERFFSKKVLIQH